MSFNTPLASYLSTQTTTPKHLVRYLRGRIKAGTHGLSAVERAYGRLWSMADRTWQIEHRGEFRLALRRSTSLPRGNKRDYVSYKTLVRWRFACGLRGSARGFWFIDPLGLRPRGLCTVATRACHVNHAPPSYNYNITAISYCTTHTHWYCYIYAPSLLVGSTLYILPLSSETSLSLPLLGFPLSCGCFPLSTPSPLSLPHTLPFFQPYTEAGAAAVRALVCVDQKDSEVIQLSLSCSLCSPITFIPSLLRVK